MLNLLKNVNLTNTFNFFKGMLFPLVLKTNSPCLQDFRIAL